MAILAHADDRDFLAQLEAVDRFTDNMYAYPGRTFGQLYQRRRAQQTHSRRGWWSWADASCGSPTSTCPCSWWPGSTDTLAPVGAVSHLVDLLTGAPDVQLVQAPGGHLGVLTGRAARRTTWPAMEGFYARHDTP
ncbi:MAG: hypothetical protein PGN15_04010 [Aeromicrobium erythreum]